MGLFDDFDIDMDEVETAGGFDFEDGFYDFEISEALIQNGTKNDPDDTKFIIKYDFDEAGTYWEWFTVAVDGDPQAQKAKQSLGFLKARLIDLGIPAAELNDIAPEDLEGIRGSLQLVTTNGKGAKAANRYQNVRNVKVEVEEEAPEPAPKATSTKAADAAAKQRVAARQAARAAKEEEPVKAAPRRRAAAKPSEEVEDENPFA